MKQTRLERNYEAAEEAIRRNPQAKIVGHDRNSMVWVWYPTSDKTLAEMSADLIRRNSR